MPKNVKTTPQLHLPHTLARSEVAQSCPTLCDPMAVTYQAPPSRDSPSKNTGVGCHFLLQGIFPTQGSDLGLLHCTHVYHLSHQGRATTRGSKVMLKILQARLQQYVNRELPDVQAGFRKARGTRDKIANNCWIIENA